MVTVPTDMPVTTPVPLTVALPLLALHTPPVVAFVRLTVLPVHTVAVAGVIAPGAEFTVATVTAAQPPVV